MASKVKYRLGIVFGSSRIPSWQATLVDEILKFDFVSIDAVFVHTKNEVRDDHRLLSRIRSLFRWAISRSRHVTANDACQLVSIPNVIQHIESEDIGVRGEIASSVQSGSQQMDILIDLAEHSTFGGFAARPRLGVWEIRHGAVGGYKESGEIGFWEAIDGDANLTSALCVTHDNSAKRTEVSRTWSAFDRSNPVMSRSEHLWKSLSLVTRTLSELAKVGERDFMRALDTGSSGLNSRGNESDFQRSTMKVAVGFFHYGIWRVLHFIRCRLYSERWVLAFQCTEDIDSDAGFQEISPPEGRFWADPHVWTHEAENYIFFEDASLDTGLGRIGVIKLDVDGSHSEQTTVIEKPYHLSYPFIFEWHGKIYMIPESGDNKTIEVYECVAFPEDWRFVGYLMEDIYAYDTTLFHYDDTWWLFANVKERVGASSWDELHLFYGDSPLSRDWTPHPLNPIVSDSRSARPAGRIFEKGGRIFRPSQNSSHRYGYSLNINEITRLSTTSYREELATEIRPWDDSIRAVHSFSQGPSLVVVDAVSRTLNSPL